MRFTMSHEVKTNMLGGLVALVVLGFFGMLIWAACYGAEQNDRDIFVTVSQVLTCTATTEYQNAKCRVEFNNGWRATVRPPVAVGDKFYYDLSWWPHQQHHNTPQTGELTFEGRATNNSVE